MIDWPMQDAAAGRLRRGAGRTVHDEGSLGDGVVDGHERGAALVEVGVVVVVRVEDDGARAVRQERVDRPAPGLARGRAMPLSDDFNLSALKDTRDHSCY